MPTIDQRIVQMSFENAKFEAGVAQTMATLGKLDVSLQQIAKNNSLTEIEKSADKVTLDQPVRAIDKLKEKFSGFGKGATDGMNEIEKSGNKVTLEQPIKALDKVKSATADVGRNAADGFNEIEKAAARTSLEGLNKALDQVSSKFTILQGAAAVALGNITSQAAAKGANFAKSFGFGPVIDGLKEYKTNLGSIQTILANTQGQKVSGLDNVNKALGELNTYSDQTIYNFSEMAKNIGTFTAAGVDLPKATQSIKGIANLAALSGSNSQQASTAMYQLSQAISSGRVGLQDWNSVVNAGMGGAVFQKALLRTADNMGTLEKGALKIDKATGKATVNGASFRDSIMAKPGQKSWLTDEVLVKTLGQLTGDLSDAELKAQGFSDAQVKAIQDQAKTAKAAATEVKTLDQVFDVARETIGSGWSKTFQLIFGDFNESKKLFTGMSNAINGWINKVSDARNKMFGDWKKDGGRTALIEGVKNAFSALATFISPISKAFRDIFPATSGHQLAEMTKGFAALMKRLTPSQEVVEGLRRTFRGLFAVVHIVWTVIKGVVGVIGDLLGVVGKGSGGFLAFTGSIGDFLTAVDSALTKGGLLTSFFKGVSSVLSAPLKLLTSLSSVIFGLFSNDGSEEGNKLGDSLDRVGDSANKLTPLLEKLKHAWANMVHIFEDIRAWIGPFLHDVGEKLSSVGDTIANAFENLDFNKTMSFLQTGFIGGIFLALKNAISGNSSALTGALGKLGGVFDGLTGNLETMQQKVKARIILEIAGAIGILAASVAILSTIDPNKLATAMTAVAVGLGELMGAMKLMTGGMTKMATIQMPVIAGSLVVLAGAVLVLSGAMKIFATMDWEEIGKGLVGVGGSLAAVGLGVKALGPSTVIQGPAILAMAIAMNLLAVAVKQFANLKWEELARGITGVFFAIAAVAVPLQAMGTSVALVGPGLIAVAFAMNLLSGAVASFGKMKPEELITGIAGIAGSLTALGLAILAIPPGIAAQAAGLVIMSIALTGIAGAVKLFGAMKVGTLVKGIVAMGGALVVLAGGLMLMTSTLSGSAALLVAAGALALLAPTLGFMGTLKWSTILKGLGAMALVLATLSAVGALASSGLVSLGVALLPLAGVLAVTAGAVFLFSKGLSLLGENGTKGLAVMVTAVTTFLALLPKLVIDFLKGLVDVIGEIAKLAPKVVVALASILETVVQFILDNAGQFAVAFGALIDAAVTAVGENAPKIIAAGAKLLLDFLGGIDRNVSQIVTKVGNIIVKFLDGLTQKAPAVIESGYKFLLAFLSGIARHISEVTSTALKIALHFLNGVVKNIPKFVEAGAKAIAGFIDSLAERLPDVIRAGIHLATSFIDGVSSQFDEVAASATLFVTRFFKAFGNQKNVADMVDAGLKAAIHILQGIADGLRRDDNIAKVIDATADIGFAMVEGIAKGLANLPKKLGEKLLGPVKGAVHSVKGFLHIKSPSRVFQEIGQYITDGMAIGLEDMGGVLKRGITDPISKMLVATESFKDFGKFLGDEFTKGLNGGLWDDGKSEAERTITDTFTALRGKLEEQQDKLRDSIKSDRESLEEELGKAPKERDSELIAKLSGNIAANEKLLTEATQATSRLVASLRTTREDLVDLSKEYTEVGEALSAAQAKLDELRQAREDAIKSYTQQFSGTPNVSNLVSTEEARLKEEAENAKLSAEERAKKAKDAAEEADRKKKINEFNLYKKALEDQVTATKKYAETLKALRDLGLDDTTYKKLLDEGVAGQEFATSLLNAGKAGIDEINNLDIETMKVASRLARKASNSLYNAGIEAAKGLIKGLKEKQSEIRHTMEDIAEGMVYALKKKLNIKSPSRVFMEVGKFSAEGLVYGLKSSTAIVTDAAQHMGDTAVESLQNSMQRMGDWFAQAAIDTEPKITPVLDLSNIRKGAAEIGRLGGTNTFQASMSSSLASAIASGTQQAAESSTDGIVEKNVVTLNQNNYSPEALSEAEIYRQTNNQLSLVKKALFD